MIRNLKALGLALCAVFAFSAVATSAASAQDKITAPLGGTTHLTGIQTGSAAENVFGTKGSAIAVNCTSGIYTGTLTGVTSESATVTPKYSGCTAFGAAAPVDVDGCDFLLTGTTHDTVDTTGKANGKEATVNLNCSHTGHIRITGLGGCTITFSDTHGGVGPTVNQNLLGVRYTNSSNKTGNPEATHLDFEVDVTVDNITYTSTSPCTGFGIKHPTGHDGFLTTKVTVKGYSDAAHTNQVSVTTS